MSTVTIDSGIYNEALRYASRKRMSVSNLFEVAVRKWMDMSSTHHTSNVYESTEYEEALKFMDMIVSDSHTNPVPVDEDGREARNEKYMK